MTVRTPERPSEGLSFPITSQEDTQVAELLIARVKWTASVDYREYSARFRTCRIRFLVSTSEGLSREHSGRLVLWKPLLLVALPELSLSPAQAVISSEISRMWSLGGISNLFHSRSPRHAHWYRPHPSLLCPASLAVFLLSPPKKRP